MIKKNFSNTSSTKDKKRPPDLKIFLSRLGSAVSPFEFLKEGQTHTDKPPLKGEIPAPTGKAGALNAIKFSVSGTLPHFTRDEMRDFLEACGASLILGVSEMTDVFVRGCENVSREKVAKAVELNLPIIDENGLLHLLEDVGCRVTFPDGKHTEQRVTFGTIDFNKTSEEAKGNTMLTEKYRPRTRDDLVGNENSISRMFSWLKNFKNQKHKALLLSGPPGVGKTTAANLVAERQGYHVVEYNASDTRNKASIEAIARASFDSSTLYSFGAGRKKNHVVIFDEVDGMSSSDRGGAKALAAAIKENKATPIICICNDPNNIKLDDLRKCATEIQFYPPAKIEVAMRLNEICKKEGIRIDRQNLLAISGNCNGDIRSALNALQLWRENVGKADKKNLDNPLLEPFEAVKRIVSDKTINLEKKVNMFMLDYQQGPDFVHDLVSYNGSINQYADALDAMCDGDVLESAMRSEQNYDLLSPFVMTAGLYPVACCPQKIQPKLRFPAFYSYVKRTNKFKAAINAFCIRSYKTLHASPSAIRESTADLVARIFFNFVSEGRQVEAVDFLSRLEIRSEDILALKDYVSLRGDVIEEPPAKVMKLIQNEFMKSHSQGSSLSKQSSQEERADYFIFSRETTKRRRKK